MLEVRNTVVPPSEMASYTRPASYSAKNFAQGQMNPRVDRAVNPVGFGANQSPAMSPNARNTRPISNMLPVRNGVIPPKDTSEYQPASYAREASSQRPMNGRFDNTRPDADVSRNRRKVMPPMNTFVEREYVPRPENLRRNALSNPPTELTTNKSVPNDYSRPQQNTQMQNYPEYYGSPDSQNRGGFQSQPRVTFAQPDLKNNVYPPTNTGRTSMSSAPPGMYGNGYQGEALMGSRNSNNPFATPDNRDSRFPNGRNVGRSNMYPGSPYQQSPGMMQNNSPDPYMRASNNMNTRKNPVSFLTPDIADNIYPEDETYYRNRQSEMYGEYGSQNDGRPPPPQSDTRGNFFDIFKQY